MTLMEFFGCTLIAFGPPFAMFCLLIAKDPIRIIILITASFFWLVSLLLSSILWTIVVPLKDVIVFGVFFSIIFQESFRYLFYRIIRRAESGLEKVSEVGVAPGSNVKSDRTQLAFVSGLGFGLMSGAFSLINILADAIGPGTVGLKGDSHHFFLASAFTTLAFILLHTSWSVILFKACDTNHYIMILYVIVSHLCASALTFINIHQNYMLSLPLLYLVLITTSTIAFYSAGGRVANLKLLVNANSH